MAATYEPIATVTTSNSQAEVEFTSISGSFTDLILIANAQSNKSGSSIDGLRLQVNQDTATNYSESVLYGDGSTAASYRGSNASYINVGVMSQTSATYQPITIAHFQNYSNTTTNKTILSRSSAAPEATYATVALWRSTSAITSFKLYLAGQTFKNGSTFTLYGIKAA